ncbi:MAG: hypothetical protein HOD92_12825 [Deltaproteobacteria bacterium]|jgi:hypothetical protein|nr:hypothetical protein [Deltaproteobacteria bacterium]
MNGYGSVLDYKEKVLACLEASKFEDAIKIRNEFQMSIHPSDVNPIIDAIRKLEKNPELDRGQRLSLLRKIKALKAFRDHGPNAKKMISNIELPEGYCGKILMVNIQNGVVHKLVCLRSGDMWHREILRNTEQELKELGFFSSSVCEIGGAYTRFEKDQTITIWGTSDDFGSCDKYLAAKIIQEAFPDRKIHIEY